ncbi:MAG: hypothetical protein WCH99_18055 [Verrucomicrobiota bacterium]
MKTLRFQVSDLLWERIKNNLAGRIFVIIGVGDLRQQKALMFATKNTPQPAAQIEIVRNKVTDLVFGGWQ